MDLSNLQKFGDNFQKKRCELTNLKKFNKIMYLFENEKVVTFAFAGGGEKVDPI